MSDETATDSAPLSETAAETPIEAPGDSAGPAADAASTAADAADPTKTAAHDTPFPTHLRDFIADNWDPAPPMPHPARPDTAAWTAARRDRVSDALPGQLIVVPAGPLKVRANDTDYPFRASSSFTWLTGETVEGSVLVLAPRADGPGHDATLYVREYDPAGQLGYFASRNGALWVGNVPTPSETAGVLGVVTKGLGDLADDLKAHGGHPVSVLGGVDDSVDALLPEAGSSAGAVTLATTLDELRLIKDEWELARLQDACDATGRGFADVVRELPMLLERGGERGERWLEGTFWRRARLEGNEVGYTSIIGAGPHATTLHWWRNHGRISDGQLLLADMGIETDELYTADVTRTMPVNGVWTPTQLKVYQAVAEAQEAGIAEVKAGADFRAAHRAAMWVLADYLHSWGILPVTAEVACNEDIEAPGAGLHRRYTLHGTSHMLGIDVHDCAAARDVMYTKGTLAAGHVLTVEPGLYFQTNDRTVPAEYRGIGVRIEDDIVVTDGAPINLSASLPRDPQEIVAWMREVQNSPAIP